MPLFRRIDPDDRALIAYIVARARDKGITLNRLRLVKLLYLIDIERVRGRREPLTGYPWIFFHYGPYAHPLVETLDVMEGSVLEAERWQDSVLYRGAPGAPSGDDWNAPTKMLVDRVVDRFGPMDTKELLDYVYFHTAPMEHAVRGEALDLALARDAPPELPRRPLRAPVVPADAKEKLAQWRAKNVSLRPSVLDPPGGFLATDEDLETPEGLHGSLWVSEDVEL